MESDWYLVNVNQYGYYRVNYDTQNWERLSKQLEEDHEVSPTLSDGCFSLHKSDRKNGIRLYYKLYLRILLATNGDFGVWVKK